MFQEQHRIFAADRRAQQAAGIERVRREYNAQAGNMREGHFTALAVINGAAIQIAADRERG